MIIHYVPDKYNRRYFKFNNSQIFRLIAIIIVLDDFKVVTSF